MSVLSFKSYKHLNRLIKNESFEPLLLWGMRMAIAAMVPLIWGMASGQLAKAVWVTLTAECICWVELKGSYAWRLRVLMTGAVAVVFFSFLGSMTGNNVWLSVLCMLGVAFLAAALKNIGDRATGLAICVYLLYIFCNAYPTHTASEAIARGFLIMLGAGWAIVVSMIMSLFMPAEQPYRRYIALIWKSIEGLVTSVSKGWRSGELKMNVRDIYLKEKEVRSAIDNSYQFYESMAHQVSEKDRKQYQLAQLRKATGLVAANVIALSDEMESLNMKELDKTFRVKLSSMLSALESCAERMSVYVISLKPEEELLTTTNINRLKKLVVLLKDYPLPLNAEQARTIKRICHLADRCVKLIESCVGRIEQMGDDKPVFQSYSLMKTLFVLHPKYWITNLRLLLNFNTFTFRYALRVSIAAAIALFIYKWFNIDHGYWLPFSVMIVIQPYFGATFKKAIDRVLGTLLGGLAGGLFVHFPVPSVLKVVVLFLTFIIMVYYIRKNYAVAAFAITLNLVLLFNIEATLSPMIIVTRALSTIAGAALAVLAGFVLLPTWDRKWLPRHMSSAITGNYVYFTTTFFSARKSSNWTRLKRNAETNNSNLFDSFNRYMQEPLAQENSAQYFDIITHSIRITRYLNSIHLEEENRPYDALSPASAAQQEKINECLKWFNKVLDLSPREVDKTKIKIIRETENFRSPFKLTEAQEVYLEKVLIELKSMHEDMIHQTPEGALFDS